MYRNFLLFAGLMSLLLFSCHKNGPGNNNNTNNTDTTGNSNDTINPPAHNWFKLKTILSTTVYASISDVYKDSTDIALDSVNRKITIKDYQSGPYNKDTILYTYSYNSNYQLIKYERVNSYSGFSINYMEFNRDASGQVTSVLSGYKNGLLAFTTGTVTYNKRGDTTFITYLDSVKKDPQRYYTGQDFFTVALLNGKLIADADFPITNKSTDTELLKYEYDASGNLIKYTDTYGNTAPRITTYQRGGQASPDLQKFFAQWMGDLFWIYRSKSFFPLQQIVYNNYILGNPVQSITDYYGNVLPFTNTFDASGNLTTLTYVSPPVGSSGKSTTTTTFRYRP